MTTTSTPAQTWLERTPKHDLVSCTHSDIKSVDVSDVSLPKTVDGLVNP